MKISTYKGCFSLWFNKKCMAAVFKLHFLKVTGHKKAPPEQWFFLNLGYNSIVVKPSDKHSDGLTYSKLL